MHPVFKPSNVELFFRRKVVRKTLRDLENRWKYGPRAPLSDQALYVDPCAVKWQFEPKGLASSPLYSQIHSGLVTDGNWDQDVVDITATKKFIACHEHFLDGKSWEETGIVEQMMVQIKKNGSFDGCYNRDDVRKRYQSIDQLYDQLSKHDRLSLRRDRHEYYRRESGGVFGHINRHGEVIRYVNGNHRFVISRILKYREIPIHIGVVHHDAVSSGAFEALRHSIYD